MEQNLMLHSHHFRDGRRVYKRTAVNDIWEQIQRVKKEMNQD
jgi:hypothetical protein